MQTSTLKITLMKTRNIVRHSSAVSAVIILSLVVGSCFEMTEPNIVIGTPDPNTTTIMDFQICRNRALDKKSDC